MGHVFFHKGDLVTLKQDLPNKPIMLVKDVPKARQADTQDGKEGISMLLGIRCFWFTDEGLYQEKTFNSKDLMKLED